MLILLHIAFVLIFDFITEDFSAVWTTPRKDALYLEPQNGTRRRAAQTVLAEVKRNSGTACFIKIFDTNAKGKDFKRPYTHNISYYPPLC